MPIAVVLTTIQSPTPGVRAIASRIQELRGQFIVIGDRKSPEAWQCGGTTYLTFEQQHALPFESAAVTPANSYTRKNMGYLVAAAGGAEWIRETDDDNAPYDTFFDEVPDSLSAREPKEVDGWVNVYSYFTDRFIWPRGFPLNRLPRTPDQGPGSTRVREVAAPFVLQAVADGDPDVDAIYRLTAPDTTDVIFDRVEPLVVPAGTWTPFNSQATTWPISLLPLMYLPATCSFRMTDIWRSYIAQKLFPGLGVRLVVTASTVFQDRNEHDLMRDFRDEIEGYIGYERFVQTLEETTIDGTAKSLLADLRIVYTALISAGFFTSDELEILDAWIADMETLGYGPAA